MTVYVLLDEKYGVRMVCGSYAVAEAYMYSLLVERKNKTSILEMDVINELPKMARYDVPALVPQFPSN